MTATSEHARTAPADSVAVSRFPTSHSRADAAGTPRADCVLSQRIDPGHPVDVVVAGFIALAHRYCGQDDIVVGYAGTGFGGATRLRSRIRDTTSFAELLGAIREQPGGPDPLVAVRTAGHGTDAGAELVLEVDEAELTFHYDATLFTPEFIERMAANLRTLLADAAERPGVPVHDLMLLAERERHYLLDRVNRTDLPYPRDASIPSLVEAQAARTPDAPAVVLGDRWLSYRELNETANRLARALLAGGARPGDRVGVSLPRTADLICLLLAIHKAGCAYVPLDPAYPADRLLAIAGTAAMAAVIHDSPSAPGWLSELDANALPLRGVLERAATEPGGDLDLAVGADAVAHLIYTSGSTGRPKGVVIHHRNVTALLAWAWETYSRDEVARVLFGTSLNFDLSVFELWCPLTMGGCAVVADNVLAMTEPNELRPTLINTVPSALNILLQRAAIPDSTVVLNVAGEPLPRELVNAAFADSSVERVFNLYGPSEDTTYSTYKCFLGPTPDIPTIGVPIHNTRVFLLDGRGRLVPRGVPGELYLAGDGLASGYIGDPERTAAVFVDAPKTLAAEGILYRTGDLARWTERGELAFLGRRDNQVKIRGYRIELGEIEAVLKEVNGIGDVAALAVKAGDDTRLVCYVGAGTADLTVAGVGAHLLDRLPYYMQPAKIVIERQLPLLPNGKVDRKALAARPVDWAAAAAGEALSRDEAEVAEVWTGLLGLTGIAPELDFFSVGGHSLLANLLAARLGERFAVPVRVSEIYEFRTVAGQAGLIRHRRAQGPAVTVGDDATARLALAERALRESARGHGVPGAGAAIYLDGQVRYVHYGLSDLDSGQARADATRQRVTCLTKVLIAYVAMMLVDRGLVALDEPLGELMPEAVLRSGRTVDITLRHLLSHTSGIDDSREVWCDTDFPDLAGYVANFQHYGQVSEPGEIFAYSACGTAIAALLIERLLGQPWRRAVNTMLLRPLGIADIAETLVAGDHYGDTVATGYLWDEEKQGYAAFHPGPQTMANDAADSFSVCLSVEEVLKLALFALEDGVTPSGRRLLPAELARQMYQPQIGIPGHHFMHSWGLGWLLFDEGVFGFNSNGSGQHNFIQVFTEQRMALVLLANGYPTFGLYEDLLRSVADRGYLRSTRESDWDLDVCTGTYAADGYRLIVTKGVEHLRYEYAERTGRDTWTDADAGELVLSGTGGFTSMSRKNILRGSITPIWSGDSAAPKFMRLGQRVVRRVDR